MEVIERVSNEQEVEDNTPIQMFVVWIDTNCGYGESDWERNSAPQKLKSALEESAVCKAGGFPSKILLDGFSPGADD